MPRLRVRRDDLASHDLTDDGEGLPLEGGDARLQVERFALTSNNISYGVAGDMLGYWKLFPEPDGWGAIPAWGYATVTESQAPALAEGSRFFGLVPMGSELIVRPAVAGPGFVDTSPHRAELSPIYSTYLGVPADAEDVALIMRPLFGTALLLELVLAEAGFDGADTVVLTSASSKTAYGLAHCLRDHPVRTVGLTSPRRVEWVRELGLYDDVLSYEQVESLGAPGGAALVDFAGDRPLVRRVHEHLADQLKRSTFVGMTHWDAPAEEEPLRGPAQDFFFAPDEMTRRGATLGDAYGEAWQSFAPVVDRAMSITRVTGGEELTRVFSELLEGWADPATGYVAAL